MKPSASIARPAGRYFKGKAPQQAPSDSESGEDDEHVQEQHHIGGDLLPSAIPTAKSSRPITVGQVKGVTQEGKVIGGHHDSSSEESSSEEEPEDERPKFQPRAAPKAQGSAAPEANAAAVAAANDESSSEYETDSEEEEAPKVALRPTFVPKRARETLLARDANTLSAEAAAAKLEEEEKQRKIDSHNMVAESLRKELVEKEAKALVTDIDDTDGLSPTTEFQEWRLRELTRLKRDKELSLAFEKEREEVERRRAMPEKERMAEDLQRAEESRREKMNAKSGGGFLQRYYHKGAFHQDDELIKNRDFQAPLESAVDVSLLPKVMQKRNFGKMSQTKYTHLADQDTTKDTGGFGFNKPGGGGGGGCFNCGGDHLKRDCPQLRDFQPSFSSHNPSTTGANNASGPSRSWGAPSSNPTGALDSSRNDRDRGRFGDRGNGRDERKGSAERRPYEERERASDHRRSGERRSRSRSPRRDRDRESSRRDESRPDRPSKAEEGRRRERSGERDRRPDEGKRRRYD